MAIRQVEETASPGRVTAPDGVFAAAYGVGPDFVRTFLRTFREVNRSARVILLVWDRSPLREVAREYEAELSEDAWFCRSVPRIAVRYRQHGGEMANKRVRVTELVGRSNPLAPRLAFLMPEILVRSLVSLAVARFFHIRDILSREEFGHVLLSDSRDVFFQADPFASPADLELAQEAARFGSDERFNDAWLADGFGPGALKAVEGRHSFCAGTIFGSHRRVLEHVREICRCVRELRTWKHGGIDQAIHNYLIANRMSPDEYTVSTNHRGRIMTAAPYMDARLVDRLLVDDDRLGPETQAALRMLREGGGAAG